MTIKQLKRQNSLDTRTHVVGELYDTEQSYVESLQVLIEKYMKPLKSVESNKSLIDSNLVDEIFYSIPEILEHHENFLSALQDQLSSNWNSSQVIGNVFIEAIINTYTAFINNWKNARHAIKMAIQAKPAFERFLEAVSREHRNKLTLDALLIMPVQRIPRYELLIKELIKHTPEDHPDYGPLIEAQKEVHELALKIDRAEKEMIQQEQLRDLEALIEGHVELQHPQRDFIRYDLVTISASSSPLTITRKERVLFLFCDLLIMTLSRDYYTQNLYLRRSVKKKVSRRANLQAAFVNSTNDLSLLEGNKFKLILRVSLDQVAIRHDQGQATQADQNQLRQHEQQKQQDFGQHLRALEQRKKAIQDKRRELERDLYTLQQMEALADQICASGTRRNLQDNLGELSDSIRLKLDSLDQQQSECELTSGQDQISMQHSAQIVKDLYLAQQHQPAEVSLPAADDVVAQSSSSKLVDSSSSHSQVADQDQPPPAPSSSSSSGKNNLDVTLEFIISNNSGGGGGSGTCAVVTSQASGNSLSLNSNTDTPSRHSSSAASAAGNSNHHQQQQPTHSETHETLVVTFATSERRQAFLQAFLDAKQQRNQQKMFTSSMTLRLVHPSDVAGSSASSQAAAQAHLMKSRSVGGSDARRAQLRHQDEVLDARLSEPLTSGGGGCGGGGRHSNKDRILAAHSSQPPCGAQMITHQMSAPLCSLRPNDDDNDNDDNKTATRLQLANNSSSSTYLPCSPSDICAALNSQQHHHHHHHHHQLMHQPASHPARLHTICCSDDHTGSHPYHHHHPQTTTTTITTKMSTKSLDDENNNNNNNVFDNSHFRSCYSKQTQQQRVATRRQYDGSLISAGSADFEKCNQISISHLASKEALLLMPKLIPRFLQAMPMTFLNTQHPALQFTNSVSAKFTSTAAAAVESNEKNAIVARSGRSRCQTVCDDKSQLWLCMSNGYVSHVALIRFEEKKCALSPPPPLPSLPPSSSSADALESAQQAGATSHEQQCYSIVPIVQSGGDICRSQITCATHVSWSRAAAAASQASGGRGDTWQPHSRQHTSGDARGESKLERLTDPCPKDADGRATDENEMSATKAPLPPEVLIKSASPPVDISGERFRGRPSERSPATRTITKSAPSNSALESLYEERRLSSSIAQLMLPHEGGDNDKPPKDDKKQQHHQSHELTCRQHRNLSPLCTHSTSNNCLGGGGGGGGGPHEQVANADKRHNHSCRAHNHHHGHHHHSHSHQHQHQHHPGANLRQRQFHNQQQHSHQHQHQHHYHHHHPHHHHHNQLPHHHQQQHNHHHHHHMYHSRHHTVPLGELRRALERQHRSSSTSYRDDDDDDDHHDRCQGGRMRPPRLSDSNSNSNSRARLAPPPANTPCKAADQSLCHSRDSSVESHALAAASQQASSELELREKARSATPPARYHSSSNVNAKRFRSAKMLRNQARLKTSLILAKLVGSAGKGSFYLKRAPAAPSSSQAGKAENDSAGVDQVASSSLENDAAAGDVTTTEAADATKQNATSSEQQQQADSALSIVDINPAIPGAHKSASILLDTSTGRMVAATNNQQQQPQPQHSLVSPLSSASSLNSTGSSLAVNSVCASSPNRGSCAQLSEAPHWASTTCCTSFPSSTTTNVVTVNRSFDMAHVHAGRGAGGQNSSSSTSGEELSGYEASGGENTGTLRGRSATLPCRNFCEQIVGTAAAATAAALQPPAASVTYVDSSVQNLAASNLRECPTTTTTLNEHDPLYKVSGIIADLADDEDQSKKPTSDHSAYNNNVDNAAADHVRSSLWLGCDDGSLIIIDCLTGAQPATSQVCGAGATANQSNSPACNLCETRQQQQQQQQQALGAELINSSTTASSSSTSSCQNVHSELKLRSPISDIKNYNDELVFVALTDGRLVVFRRARDETTGVLREWQLTQPQILTIATDTTTTDNSRTSRLCLVDENHLWYSHGRQIYILNISSMALEETITTTTTAQVQDETNVAQQASCIDSMQLVRQLDGVWISFKGAPLLQLYGTQSRAASEQTHKLTTTTTPPPPPPTRLLLEINLTEPINKVLSCGNEILSLHKSACLGATSMLSLFDERENTNSLFVGTSAGLIIYLTLTPGQLAEWQEQQRIASSACSGGGVGDAAASSGKLWSPQVVSLRHGHSGQVRLLRLVELTSARSGGATMSHSDSDNLRLRPPPPTAADLECDKSADGDADNSRTTLCLVSGGAGLDLYGPLPGATMANALQCNQQQQHPSGDEDCMNHLILWEL